MSKNRYSSQQQIEDISRSQLEECLFLHNWITDPIRRDLGEDYSVRIYNDDGWSGLSFYLQLKGTKNISKYLLDSGEISFPIEVEDILHWSDASLPIVVMVWDVKHRAGVWKAVANIIDTLNNDNPSWKTQTTVNIRFPSDNTTNDEGLKQLRYQIANFAYATISQNKSLDLGLNLRVPNTSEGEKFIEDLENFRKRGGEFTIPPEFIADVTAPDWHQKLFGEVIFSKDHPVFVASRESDPVLTRFDLISPDGDRVSLPFIELKGVSGEEEGVVSNNHQDIPIQFAWYVNFVDGSSHMEVNLPGSGGNVVDILDALNFIHMAMTPKSKLFVKSYKSSKPLIIDLPKPLSQDTSLYEFQKLIEKLCFIQHKTGKRIALDTLSIDEATAQTISELYSILKRGKSEVFDSVTTQSLSYASLQFALQCMKQRIAMKFSNMERETFISLLNIEFDLGVASWDIVGLPNLTEEELEKMLNKMEPDEVRMVDILVFEAKAEFEKWQ